MGIDQPREFCEKTMKSGSLEYWRNYFRTANCDIFNIIDHAIIVAASDCPNEFRIRSHSIVKRFFSGKDGGCKSFDTEAAKLEAGSSKESKANSGSDDHGGINKNQVRNFSSGQADELLRIREILHNSKEETDSVLFESLRRLQPLALSVDLLRKTEIGKAVNPLRKHSSKEIRQLARTLIDGWKAIVDEWIKSSEAIEEGTPDSVNTPVVDEEEVLPSPPLDEVAVRQSKPIYTDSNSQQKKEIGAIPKRPLVSDDVSAQAKLEATNKRKLYGSYQQDANAKKQRTIGVTELHDLPKPKQGHIGHRNPHSKLWKLLGRRR